MNKPIKTPKNPFALTENRLNLLKQATAIHAQEAADARAIGFMPRAIIQANIPHKNPNTNEFKRSNGPFKLVMYSPYGLPYGSLARLLLAWLTTEAVTRKQRTFILGDTLSSFMAQLHLVPTGGRFGSITRLREQSKRLFSTYIAFYYEETYHHELSHFCKKGFEIAKNANLWWNPIQPSESKITLGYNFFMEITHHPVPIDMRVLQTIKKSPMAIDIYCWLTYRMSYLRKPTCIPWHLLQFQFGADYKRLRDFKRHFLKQLQVVTIVYTKAMVKDSPIGLILHPSPTHVPIRPPR